MIKLLSNKIYRIPLALIFLLSFGTILGYAQYGGAVPSFNNSVIQLAGKILILWVITAVYSLIGLLLLLLMVIDCLKYQKKNQLLWILVLVFEPIFGPLIYYFKIKKERAKNTANANTTTDAQSASQIITHPSRFPVTYVLAGLIATIIITAILFYSILSFTASVNSNIINNFVNATANTPFANLSKPYIAALNQSFNPTEFNNNNNNISCVGLPEWTCTHASFDPGGLLYISLFNVAHQALGNTIIACAAKTDTNGMPIAQNTNLGSSFKGFYSLGVNGTEVFPGGWMNCPPATSQYASEPCGSNIQINECFDSSGKPLNTTELQEPLTEYVYLGYNSSDTQGPIDTIKMIAEFSSIKGALTTTSTASTVATTSVISSGAGPETKNTNFGPSCQSSSGQFNCSLEGLYQNGTAIFSFNDTLSSQFQLYSLTCFSYYPGYSWQNSKNVTISIGLNNENVTGSPITLQPSPPYPFISYGISIPCRSSDGSFNFGENAQVELSVLMKYRNSGSSSNDSVLFNASTYGGSVT